MISPKYIDGKMDPWTESREAEERLTILAVLVELFEVVAAARQRGSLLTLQEQSSSSPCVRQPAKSRHIAVKLGVDYYGRRSESDTTVHNHHSIGQCDECVNSE